MSFTLVHPHSEVEWNATQLTMSCARTTSLSAPYVERSTKPFDQSIETLNSWSLVMMIIMLTMVVSVARVMVMMSGITVAIHRINCSCVWSPIVQIVLGYVAVLAHLWICVRNHVWVWSYYVCTTEYNNIDANGSKGFYPYLSIREALIKMD